jgi:hypothetical protein
MVRHLAALGNYLEEIQRKPQNERISWALERSFRTRK